MRIKRIIALLLAFVMTFSLAGVDMKNVNAEETLLAFDSEVLAKNATANSEKDPASGNDGPAEWAFDEEVHWWHSYWDSAGSTSGVVSSSNPIWIQTGFDKAWMVKEIEYLSRTDEAYGRINAYTLYVANLDDPTATPTDDDFTEVVSGNLEDTAAVRTITLDDYVEATHIRLETTELYTNGGTAHVTAQNIKIYGKVVEGEEVTINNLSITEPTKTTYYVGEELDTTGLAVKAVYTDASEVDLEEGDYTVSELDSTTVGEKTITVTYEDKTVTFKVTVVEEGSPEDGTKDVDLSKITITAGSEVEEANASDKEGSIEFAFDENENTFWHSEWNPSWYGTDDCEDHLYVDMEFEEATVVDAVRYLPRENKSSGNAANGHITSYTVLGKTSADAEWTELTTGTWSETGKEWKIAEFEATELTAVRLAASATAGDEENKFASALEIRVRTAEISESVTEIFTDVIEGKWYVDAVQYVYDRGIMSGNEGLFGSQDAVTRAQVVTTLYNLEGAPEVTDYSACEDLIDVEEGAWYTDAVCWAYNMGIGTGNSDTKMFNMDSPVIRQQIASFFYRYAEYKGLDVTASEDISDMLNAENVSAYAETAVKWAVAEGIISGAELLDDAGNTVYDLRPRENATRAQIASIIMKFCERYGI